MNDNIFSINGGKGQSEEKKIPSNNYSLVDVDHEEYLASGFLIFTAQHVAVMRDDGAGAIPVLVLPMSRFMVAELDEDDEEVSELPF